MEVLVLRVLGLRGWNTFLQPGLIGGNVALGLDDDFGDGGFAGGQTCDYGQCVRTGLCCVGVRGTY